MQLLLAYRFSLLCCAATCFLLQTACLQTSVNGQGTGNPGTTAGAGSSSGGLETTTAGSATGSSASAAASSSSSSAAASSTSSNGSSAGSVSSSGGTTGGSSSGTSGGTTTSGDAGPQCEIQGQDYPAGSINPNNACEDCEPLASGSVWTTLADGAACGGSIGLYISGTCKAQICFIAGIEYSAKQANPTSECQQCDPTQATTAWTNLDGAYCLSNGGNVCFGGTCQSGCYFIDNDGCVALDGGVQIPPYTQGQATITEGCVAP